MAIAKSVRACVPWIVLAALLLACADEGHPEATQTYAADGRRLGTAAVPDRRPNLIVVVLDSLRHDAYAAPSDTSASATVRRERMPFLSALAARGISFSDAVASAPWTLPSIVSLLTGLLPSEHGQFVVHADWNLPAAITTYPEVLSRGYGYRTVACVCGLWFERSGDSLLQGFDRKSYEYSLQDHRRIRRWAETRDTRRPFFLLLHSFDAHEPYGAKNHPWPVPKFPQPPEVDPSLLAADAEPRSLLRACALDADARLGLSVRLGYALSEKIQGYRHRGYAEHPDPALAAELEAAYWAGVRWADGELEKTVALFEELGLMKDTVLVVTADHGESFGEHGDLGHGLWLYDEVIRVPLVVVGPEPFVGGRTIRQQVGLIDVLPTFLDYAGFAPNPGVTGRSAMAAVRGASSSCRAVVSEERLDASNTGTSVDAVRLSARTPAWKYIATFDLQTGEVRESAYDLENDPGEKVDLGDGTGRLPPDVLFDACTCPAVTALRERIWSRAATEGDTPDGSPQDATAIPYGSAAPRPRTAPPLPCTQRN